MPPSISLRDVSHRNAKKPKGSTPRMVPGQARLRRERPDLASAARRSRRVPATSSSTLGRSPPLRRCSVSTPARSRASSVPTSYASTPSSHRRAAHRARATGRARAADARSGVARLVGAERDRLRHGSCRLGSAAAIDATASTNCSSRSAPRARARRRRGTARGERRDAAPDDGEPAGRTARTRPAPRPQDQSTQTGGAIAGAGPCRDRTRRGRRPATAPRAAPRREPRSPSTRSEPEQGHRKRAHAVVLGREHPVADLLAPVGEGRDDGRHGAGAPRSGRRPRRAAGSGRPA